MVYMYSRGSDKLAPEGFRAFSSSKPDYISTSLVPHDEQYSVQVREYSTRKLTFGSDKVNAFMGVLNSFGEHQYGLPHRILDQAMIWSHCYEPTLSGPIKPGENFPSWSWASTVGRIEYRYLPSNERPMFSLATWAILRSDQASNKPVTEVLDTLHPRDHPEALNHPRTIRDYIEKLEMQTGYDPVEIAIVANFCERHRLIQQEVLHQSKPGNTSDTALIADENSMVEKMWRGMMRFCFDRVVSMFVSGPLSEVKARMKPFRKASWFADLDNFVRRVPKDVRIDTLMRMAKPSLPNLVQKFSLAELEAASEPGRIIVHAPKTKIQLKYTQLCFKGAHVWTMQDGDKPIGMAELSELKHQEVLVSIPRDTGQDKVEVHCIALALMACRVRYNEKGRTDISMTSDSFPTIFVMIASMPLMSYSHRLGLGFIGYPDWAALGEVPIETTILD